jgi:hypothetical protein
MYVIHTLISTPKIRGIDTFACRECGGKQEFGGKQERCVISNQYIHQYHIIVSPTRDASIVAVDEDEVEIICICRWKYCQIF